MPRYTKRDFQCGEYWLSQQRGSPAWCRTWYDAKTRQTRRVSLGTVDVQEAKQKLTEWFAAQYQAPSEDLPPSAVKLAEVLLDYWNHQASKLRSASTIKVHLRYWNEFWGDVSVADVRNPVKQEDFRNWLFARGNAHNSVNRCLEAGRAAIRRAWKRGVISSAPFVHMLPETRTEPMGRPLTPDEWGAILHGATQDHVRVFILLGLATGARPEAITDLTWDQIDFANGLIHLLPKGKRETKKRRPTVKMPDKLAAYLLANKVTEFKSERRTVTGIRHLVHFRGKPVGRLDTSWEKALKAAGVGNVTLYSPRVTAAQWMSREGVPLQQIAEQLGHKMKGFDVTYRYISHRPDYLPDACASLDRLLSVCLAAWEQRRTPDLQPTLSGVSAEEINQVQSEAWLT